MTPDVHRRLSTWCIVLALGLLAACTGPGNAEPSGMHRVSVGGWGSEDHVSPARVEAHQGDRVEFTVVDHRVHTVRFESDVLTAEQRSFLEDAGVLASPPLVEQGARFVVSLEDAPSGRYAFIVEGFGSPVQGEIIVAGN